MLKPSLNFNHKEWVENSITDIQEADKSRFEASKVRGEASLLIEERLTKTFRSQEEVTKKIGERVHEISDVIVDLKQELKLNEDQTQLLTESLKHLDFVLGQTKRPLIIALKCLNIREEKVDIEHVKDLVEKYLKTEVDTIKSFQGRIQILSQLIEMQIFDCEEKQESLRSEVEKKEKAFDIDQKCHILNEKSTEINKFGGIELVEPDASVPLTWRSDCVAMIKDSSTSRDVSSQLMTDVDNIIQEVSQELYNNWIRTNKEFKIRISETFRLQTQLKTNVKLIEDELKETHGLIDQLQRAKLAKEAPVRLAQTRLYQRSHRPGTELCLDKPHHLLVEEVNTLIGIIFILKVTRVKL